MNDGDSSSYEFKYHKEKNEARDDSSQDFSSIQMLDKNSTLNDWILACSAETIASNHKRIGLSKISASQRLEIVKMAKSKLLTHKEISDIFNVRATTISKLVATCK